MNPSIRAATFLQVLGQPASSLRNTKPLAIIAINATYCEDGPQVAQDEFFNMAALLLLDDMKVALILTWAFDILENEGFFGIVLVGNELVEVMNHASCIFESPGWTWQNQELIEWFGFDMTKVGSFENKQQLLEKLPGMSSAIASSPFRDLEDFVEHMHNLRPTLVPEQGEQKTRQVFLVHFLENPTIL